jgi:hypothetical protein
VATLRSSPGVSSLRSDFVARQDEYLIGVVGERAHRDRLRDADAPIHDIHVPPDGIGDRASVDEIVHRSGISVAYRDGNAGEYVRVALDQLDDTSMLWRPREPRDRFPLVVLRARFPAQQAGRERRIELGYDYVLSDPEEGWWFWTASRPVFVSTITVDATDLERTCKCTFGKFLPTFEEEENAGGKHVVHVSNWLLKGHGVTLTWWPRDRGR